jgi:5-(carboxyamino)imidazole ribonucleotide mutase
MSFMKVAIFFGSKSDIEVMRGCASALKEFGVEYESFILSAHRVPEKLSHTLKTVHNKGCEVIIAGAGLAAHLPGVIASQTILPVIGVPIKSELSGLDALLSIVQMPKSIPVATVGVNNSYNAGMLAIQILALKYPKINAKLVK